VVQIDEHPPVVNDKHIQQTLEILWRSAAPEFLALQLAKYVHREPSLLPILQLLMETLDRQDLARVQARLAHDPRETQPQGFAWRETYPAPPPPALEIRIDPELGRLAVALNLAAEFRLWCAARHHFGIPGWTTRQTLLAQLREDGVPLSKRHYNRLLANGSGLFWGQGKDDRIWLRSVVKVAQRLTALAVQTQPELVATNLPGVRDMYLRIDGDMQRFKARIYAGWMAYREDPVIARSTLAGLFNCTPDTLRNWEALLGPSLSVVRTWAQSAIDLKDDDRLFDYLPSHAYTYLTRKHQVRLRWQLPNRYVTRFILQHGAKGQSRKVRAHAALTAWSQPVELCANSAEELRALPFDRSHRVPRRYFATQKHLMFRLKLLEKQGKVGISPETPRYVFRGADKHGYGIYELTLDKTLQTTAWERMSIRREYLWRAGERRKQEAWLARQAKP
jgi:hypothetical protein